MEEVGREKDKKQKALGLRKSMKETFSLFEEGASFRQQLCCDG